jgi:hypothetical protein
METAYRLKGHAANAAVETRLIVPQRHSHEACARSELLLFGGNAHAVGSRLSSLPVCHCLLPRVSHGNSKGDKSICDAERNSAYGSQALYNGLLKAVCGRLIARATSEGLRLEGLTDYGVCSGVCERVPEVI